MVALNESRKVILDTLKISSSRLFTGVSTILVSSILAKSLLPEEVGFYYLIFSYAQLSSYLFSFGSGISAHKQIAISYSKGCYGKVLGTVNYSLLFLIFTGGIGVVCVCIFNTTGWYIEFLLEVNYLTYIALWGWLISMLLLEGDIFRAVSKINYGLIFGGVLFNAILLSYWCGYYLFGMPINIDIALNAILYSLFVSVFIGLIFWIKFSIVDLDLTNKSFFYVNSFPVLENTFSAFYALGFFVLSQGDIWLASKYLEGEVLGGYALIVRIIVFSYFAQQVINFIVSPKIAVALDKKEYDKVQLLTSESMLKISLPFLIVVLTVVPFLYYPVQVIFGVNYEYIVEPLKYMLAAHVILIVMGPSEIVLLMSGESKRLSFIVAFCVVGMFVGGSLVAPQFGLEGILLSAFLARLFSKIMTVYYCWKLFKVLTFRVV